MNKLVRQRVRSAWARSQCKIYSFVRDSNSNRAIVYCPTEHDLESFGAKLGRISKGRDVVFLTGSLGTGGCYLRTNCCPLLPITSAACEIGKTTLARATIRSLLQQPNLRVTSPSFLLVNSYEANESIRLSNGVDLAVHMDLYRLPENTAAEHLGLPELFDDSSAVTLIEWPQRLREDLVPKQRLHIDIQQAVPDSSAPENTSPSRILHLTGHGDRWQRALRSELMNAQDTEE